MESENTLNTPDIEDNIIDESSLKEFNYTKNNYKYLIQIGKNLFKNKIIIKINSQSSVDDGYYTNELDLEQLQKIHKSFRFFDTIEETLTSLIDIFESNKYELDIEENKIMLKLKVPKFGSGEDTISIEIKKKCLSFENLCKNLCKKINILDRQMNDLTKEINILKEENKKKDLIIMELKEWKDNIIKKEEEEEEEKKKYKIDSKIIEKKEELDLLFNRLKENSGLKDKNISFKLIFRGTEDGKNSTDFHRKCDGIGKTISIIKTIKGYKFGGYAEKPWKSEGSWIYDDEKAFVFSLNNMKIYNAVYGKYKYYWGKNFGPNFYSFWPCSNMFAKSGNNVLDKNNSNQYFSGFSSDYELNGGEKNFITQELEVFQIIFL